MLHTLPLRFLTLLTVFVGGLLAFHRLEKLAPVHAAYGTGPRRRGYFADIIASLMDGPVLGSLTKLVAANLVILIPQHFDWFARWPWALQFGLFFLVNDFGRYWLHRWYHESDLLWRMHRVHHTVTEMDSLSAFRVHVGEGVIKYGVLILPFHLLGIDRWATVLYSSIDILKGFWHHANLRTYIGPLNLVFNSAEQHWWHHSVEGRGQRSNYGSVLSIWDRLFGTFFWPRGQWPERIGVDGLEAFPDDYLGQFASVIHDEATAAQRYGGSSTAESRHDAVGSSGEGIGEADLVPVESAPTVTTSPA